MSLYLTTWRESAEQWVLSTAGLEQHFKHLDHGHHSDEIEDIFLLPETTGEVRPVKITFESTPCGGDFTYVQAFVYDHTTEVDTFSYRVDGRV